MKIGLTNITGRMGKELVEGITKDTEVNLAIGLTRQKLSSFPAKLTQNIASLLENSEVVIDFSIPLITAMLLTDTQSRPKPLVIGTTGLSAKEYNLLQETSSIVPILQDNNMSIGINLINSLLPKIANILEEGFDIDIIDKHHRNKKDSPSGTAIKLLNTIKEARKYKSTSIYNEVFTHEARAENSVGIFSIRSGNIFGEHEVIFASENEIISLNHSALNRKIFAEGAIKAAKWLTTQPPGLYSMKDVLNF